MLNKYVNIPFVDNGDSFIGADCFGLGRLIYKEELGIELFEHTSDPKDVKNILLEYAMESKENWVEVAEPKRFDIIAMARDLNHPDLIQHFGIYIGDGKILHTLENIGSHITTMKKEAYFIKTIHRHKELLNA